MEEYGSLLDLPSPSGSPYYVYGQDGEPYSSESQSQSPSNSAYDMASATDLSRLSSVYPSPEREEGSPQPTSQQKPAAKRKRENRYKNAPPSVLSRRRAQNRASQRAYRERKDQRIKDLEQMLSDAKQRNDVLGQAYAALHAEYVALKASQHKDHGYHSATTELPPYGAMPHHHTMSLGAGHGEGVELHPMFVYSDINTGYPL